jgi:hypothetical protein
LGHAIFPLRGAASQANSTAARALIDLAWIVAMTGFVAGGFGLTGARPLNRLWRPFIAVAAGASIVAFSAMRRLDFLPSVLFNALALAAFYGWANRAEANDGGASALRSARFKRVCSWTASALAVLMTMFVATCALTRSWRTRWGVTDQELNLALPGDPPKRSAAFEINHAVTIDAPPSTVWPWLAQLGQDRGGFYSYTELENIWGLRIRNAERIHREWQSRAVGDLVRAAPRDWLGGRFGENLGWKIALIDPERALVLEGWGAFVLEAIDEGRSRLFVRSQITGPNIPVWAAALSFITFEPIHFVMERRMLLGIKERAESHIEPWQPPSPRVEPETAIAGH